MAEDNEGKTEAATPARLSRIRGEGHAPVSHELASFANLAAALLVIMGIAPSITATAAGQLRVLLERAGSIDSAAAVIGILKQAAAIGAGALLPVAFAVALTGAGVVLAQTRLAMRLGALSPDISRINPMSGISKLFSANNGVNALKSLLKISVLSFALYLALKGQSKFLPASLVENLGAVPGSVKGSIVTIGFTLIPVQAGIAVLDVAWTQVNFARTNRMSREEVKQENKDADGDPHVKAKRRAIRNARHKQNLQKAMQGATVVVTNPTHYAVALAYERNSAKAPKVVAKGVDERAARIREMAAENRVPIVPNPPLARALHKLELDAEIPLEHYKAVADIIAYIWRLEAQAARARMI